MVSPSVLPSAQSADSTRLIERDNSNELSSSLVLSDEDTLRRGNVLSIGRPYWLRVTESEMRLAWLKTMVRKELVVRDLDSYAKSISIKLRSEEYRMREEERKILLGIMTLKLKDEKKYLASIIRKKEEMKRKIMGYVGRNRKYNTLLNRLRKECIKRKTELKIKYEKKTTHLENE